MTIEMTRAIWSPLYRSRAMVVRITLAEAAPKPQRIRAASSAPRLGARVEARAPRA